MSMHNEARRRFHWLLRSTATHRDSEAWSADQFVEVHTSHIPWDDDRPVVREDEHYEVLEHLYEFPSERAVHPWLVHPKLDRKGDTGNW